MSNWAVTYDLGKAPASWDFLNWLINAEIERRLNDGGPLRVRFVEGPKDGFRNDTMPRPTEQRRAIFENVMIPALRLIGAERGNEDNQRAPSYTVGPMVTYAKRGIPIPKWEVPPEYMDQVSTWLAGRKPLVITLREATYFPERNSNMEAWKTFAKTCGEDVVFVRDTSKADVPLDGFETCPQASKDLLVRAALMAQAKCNLMVANGPIALAMFLVAPWLMFKPLTPNLPDYRPGQPEYWERLGIGHGGQIPWASEQQRIVWGDDTLENIESAWATLNGREDPHPIKKIPQIITKGALNDDQRFEHTKANIKLVEERVPELPAHSGTAIVVCYGPSLKTTWPAIRHERNTIPGAKVVTVSGAHDFLIKNRVVPNYHVECDPRLHKADMINLPKRKVEYLLASCVHPDLLRKLQRNGKVANISLWHLSNGDESMRIINDLEPNSFLIGGGGSVGLRAVCVMHAMGFRKFVIHGMDCSFEGDEQHAGAHTGKRQNAIKVRCGSREFITSPVLISYARQFQDMVRLMAGDCQFDMHGDGLLQAMCREAVARSKSAA